MLQMGEYCCGGFMSVGVCMHERQNVGYWLEIDADVAFTLVAAPASQAYIERVFFCLRNAHPTE